MADSQEGVIVLGATGSIGASVAHEIIARGGKVFLAGRNAERLAAVAAETNASGTAAVDASQPASFAECFKAAKEALPSITGVVNCIGSVLLKPAHLTTDDELHDTLQVNLATAFFTVREAAKVMRSGGGSVVLCSTAAAQVGLANHEAIAAAKGGVDGLVRSSAATYGPRGVRVNAVAPGLVKSEMTRKIWENEASATASQDMHVLGRLGEPGDVARAISFLLHPENNWVTGQVIGVDGGLGGIVTRPRQRTN